MTPKDIPIVCSRCFSKATMKAGTSHGAPEEYYKKLEKTELILMDCPECVEKYAEGEQRHVVYIGKNLTVLDFTNRTATKP
jgi:hypothetical protein